MEIVQNISDVFSLQIEKAEKKNMPKLFYMVWDKHDPAGEDAPEMGMTLKSLNKNDMIEFSKTHTFINLRGIVPEFVKNNDEFFKVYERISPDGSITRTVLPKLDAQ